MKLFAKRGAVLLIALAAAIGVLAGCGGGGSDNRVEKLDYAVEHYFQNLSDDGYTPDESLSAQKSADKGTTVTETPVVKEGFAYDAVNPAAVNGVELNADGTVIKLYYNRLTLTVAYDKNSPTATGGIEPRRIRYGETVRAEENAFVDAENIFLGWNTDRHGFGQSYAPGDRVTAAASLTLYAQWQPTYRSADAGIEDRIYLTDESGLGSSVLLRGEEVKKGFYDAETGIAEFFYESGDVAALLDADTMRFRYRDDEIVGIYEFFDYTTDSVLSGVVMNLDGFGFATYSIPNGSGMLASYGGSCEETDAGDYLFTITMGPEPSAIGAQMYLKLDRYATSGEFVVGKFSFQGEEYGARFAYGNGELGNDQLQLDGYGSAVYFRNYRVDSDTYEQEIAGAYRASDEYGDWHGEYVFTSADGQTSFRFIALDFQSNGNLVLVFMPKNAVQAGVYTDAGLTGATLELDGYDGAYYTDGDVSMQGSVIDDGNRNLTITLLDTAGAVVGTMTVRVDYSAKTFDVYSDGLVYADDAKTIISAYTAAATAVVVPEGVIEIQPGVFKNASLTSLTLPSTLTTVGEYAFQNNSTLALVRVAAATPPALGAGAFRWPKGDLQILVPDGCEDAYRAAAGWTDYADYITSEAELANRPEFEIKNGVLVRYTCKAENPVDLDVRIPDGVTEIAAGVFRNREYIRSVDLNGVQILGESAFDTCVNLASVTGAHVETIGNFAFFGCEKLNDLVFPAAVSVGDKAFSDCYALESVRLGADLTAIGTQAFEYTAYEDVENMVLGTLHLTLDGETPPTMGAKVFGFTPTRIHVKNIDVALRYLDAATWPSYVAHLMVTEGAEAGRYYCVTDQSIGMLLNGRAEFDGINLLLYRIADGVVTYYYYDKEAARTTTFTGAFDAETGYLSIVLDNTTYVFYREGELLTYRSADDGDLIVENGTGKVTFGGKDYDARIGRGNFVISDGVTDYTVTLYADMTYSVVRKATTTVTTYTAADGAKATITDGGSVFGTLENIIVDEIAMSQSYLFGVKTADGYEFTVNYRENKYTVRLVVDKTEKTFTYSWEKL